MFIKVFVEVMGWKDELIKNDYKEVGDFGSVVMVSCLM